MIIIPPAHLLELLHRAARLALTWLGEAERRCPRQSLVAGWLHLQVTGRVQLSGHTGVIVADGLPGPWKLRRGRSPCVLMALQSALCLFN